MRKANVNTAKFPSISGVTFTPEPLNPISEQFTSVYYEGQRIAIINGISSPLQWTAKNVSNVPLYIIEGLEAYCSNNVMA